MIDAQTTRPIQCECCGFAFKFAASEHSTEVSCPACGGENLLTHCLRFPCKENLSDTPSDNLSDSLLRNFSNNVSNNFSKNCAEVSTQNRFSLPLISDADLMKCRAKNCPRIKRSSNANCFHHENSCQNCHENSCTVEKVSEYDNEYNNNYRSDYKQWITLLLTVCVQIIVLFGALFFILIDGRKAAQPDHSSSQVIINKGTDFPIEFPTTTTAPLLATVRSETMSAETIKPENIKLEIVKPNPAVANVVTKTKSSETNVSEFQKQKKNNVSNKLPQTERIDKPTQPLLSETTATNATETKKLITEPATTDHATKKMLAQNVDKNEDKNEQSKNNDNIHINDQFETVQPKPLPLETISAKPAETTKVALKKENATNKLLPEVIRVAAAEALLEEAVTSLISDPEQSLQDILSAVGTFEEFGRSLPSTAYWILSQTYASLSWGKMFLINLPAVENLTISSDSHWLLTQCQDNSVWIWDLFRDQNNRNGVQLDSGKIPFVKLLFSPDLRLIIGGRTDGTLQIWDMARPNPAEAPVTLNEKVIGLSDLQISPDGCWLAAFGGSAKSSFEIVRNNRYINDVGSSMQIATVFGEDGNYFCNLNEPIPPCRIVRLHSMLPLPDTAYGTPMISNSTPVKVTTKPVLREQHFSLRKNIQVSFLSESSVTLPEKSLPKATDISVSETIVLSEPNVVWLWDLRQIQNGFIPPPIVLRGHDQEIRLIQFSADSGKLAVGGKNSTTLIYDLRNSKTDGIPLVLRGHHLDITAIAFAPNGSWVATGSRDNTIRLWNLTDSKKVTNSVVLNGHCGWISSLTVDQSGTRLFSGSYDKTIRVWRLDRNDIKTATEREPLVLQSNQGVIQELALSPDGKKLISLGGDNSLRMRNIVDGTIVDDRHSVMFRNRMLPISKIALTPDNRWLVFGYTNQKNPANSGIRLWPLHFDHLLQIASENE
ncbi:MAG: hypothetical protein LBI18_01220 [Planctomycetaceae bacterium]|jgi:WD40 repeat protein|nr:hypothetical protein [Planctomycetaceae bacterium]